MNVKPTSLRGYREKWPYLYFSPSPSSFLSERSGALRDRCSAPVCCSGQTGSSSASCRRTSGGTPPSTDALPHQCCLEEVEGKRVVRSFNTGHLTTDASTKEIMNVGLLTSTATWPTDTPPLTHSMKTQHKYARRHLCTLQEGFNSPKHNLKLNVQIK